MKKGALTHPKQGAGAAPHCVADARKNTAVSFTTGGKAVGKGGYLLHRGLTSGALSYKESTKPCNLADWMVLSVKQALVEQRMYREREESHREWPDHTTIFIVSTLKYKGEAFLEAQRNLVTLQGPKQPDSSSQTLYYHPQELKFIDYSQ